MAAQVVVIIGVGQDRGASRIESNLEVIRQVTIGGHASNDEARLGDVSPVNHVVACFGLTEGRTAFNVSSERVKDMPIRRVVTGSEFIAAVPNNPNSAGDRPGRHPREDSGLSLRSIADTDGRTPRIAFIRRKSYENTRSI